VIDAGSPMGGDAMVTASPLNPRRG
jgi:hypothetical protein